MPLIKCPDCSREISHTAHFCPACGHRPHARMLNGADYIPHVIIFTGIFVLAAGILQVGAGAPSPAPTLTAGLQIIFAGMILLALRSLR